MTDDIEKYIKQADEKRERHLLYKAARYLGLINQVQEKYPGVNEIVCFRDEQLIIISLDRIRNFISTYKYLPASYRWILKQALSERKQVNKRQKKREEEI